MLASSAYRTKRWPRSSSSRSSSSSTILLSNGESGPPCGTPSSVFTTTPSGITTLAFEHPLDEHDEPPVLDLRLQPRHQALMVDTIEKLFRDQNRRPTRTRPPDILLPR